MSHSRRPGAATAAVDRHGRVEDARRAMEALTDGMLAQWWALQMRRGACSVRLYYRRDERGPDGVAAMLASADAPGDEWQVVEGLALGAGHTRPRARHLIEEQLRRLPLLYAANDGSRKATSGSPAARQRRASEARAPGVGLTAREDSCRTSK